MYDTEIKNLETLFLALADQTRLRLLNLMREDEVCVNWLAEILNESQPKISRHLAYLRSAKIVSTRRDGKWIYYQIEPQTDDLTRKILLHTLECMSAQKQMREEYQNLLKISRNNGSFELTRKVDGKIYEKAYVKRKSKEELEIFLL